MDFGIAGVAAITVIAYAAGQAMKAWGRGERWIPTVCAVLGGILGVVGLYVMPGFPANDVITAAAIGMEKLCAARGLAGRLIPVPRALTADCGMAWRAEIDRRAALEALAAGEGLEVEGFYELTL